MDSYTGPWVEFKGRKLPWKEPNASTDTCEVEGSSRTSLSVVDSVCVLTVENEVTRSYPEINDRSREQDVPRTMSMCCGHLLECQRIFSPSLVWAENMT